MLGAKSIAGFGVQIFGFWQLGLSHGPIILPENYFVLFLTGSFVVPSFRPSFSFKKSKKFTWLASPHIFVDGWEELIFHFS